ncbi:pum, partial [Symbiodinium sp. KB8]
DALQALATAPARLREDRLLVLAAVQVNGWALDSAAAKLKRDREVVMAAVRQSGLALQFAHRRRKSDLGVVLAAVEENGSALEFAAPELRGDPEVVLAAVRQDGTCFQFASPELCGNRSFVLQAIQATRAWWLLKFVSAELLADESFVEECRACAGFGLVFTFYENYSCSAMMRKLFKTTVASVPGGTAYQGVMEMLNGAEHGSTATVWFGDELVFGNSADDGNWIHPSGDCGRDDVPVPIGDCDAKWRSPVESRSARQEPDPGESYKCWCCHWIREVRKHHETGAIICCAVSNIYERGWVEEYSAGSSELSDADATALELPREVFRNGQPRGWGEGTIRISKGLSFHRKAPIHSDTRKPLGVGCRWERHVLDNLGFPVYAFFMP